MHTWNVGHGITWCINGILDMGLVLGTWCVPVVSGMLDTGLVGGTWYIFSGISVWYVMIGTGCIHGMLDIVLLGAYMVCWTWDLYLILGTPYLVSGISIGYVVLGIRYTVGDIGIGHVDAQQAVCMWYKVCWTWYVHGKWYIVCWYVVHCMLVCGTLYVGMQ
jgi:hypothetical protein